MKSPFAGRLLFGNRRRREDPSRCAPPQRKKPLFEALEARVLLSADVATAGVGDALTAGLDQLQGRLQEFFDNSSLLNTEIPLIVRPEFGDAPGQILNVAPKLRDLLGLPVDLNFDGSVDAAGLEHELDLIDNSGINNGVASIEEILDVKFFDPLRDIADQIGAAEADTASEVEGLVTGLTDTLGSFLDLNITEVDVVEGAHQLTIEFDFSLAISRTLPLDLGIGADNIGLSFPSADLSVVGNLDFGLTLGVMTSGETAATSDFFVMVDTMTARVTASATDLDVEVNVGFLGADVVDGSISLIGELAIGFVDPTAPTNLGISALHLDNSAIDPIVANNPLSGFVLTRDAAFYLRIGDADAVEVVVSAAATVGNASFAHLAQDVQDAIEAAGFDDGLDNSLVEVNVDPTNRLTFTVASTNPTPLGFDPEEFSGAGISTLIAGETLFNQTATFLISVGGALFTRISVNTGANLTATINNLNAAFTAAGLPATVRADSTTPVGESVLRLRISDSTGKSLQISRALAIDSSVTLNDLLTTSGQALLPASVDADSEIEVTLPITVRTGLGIDSTGLEISFNADDPFSFASTAFEDADGNVRLDFDFDTSAITDLLDFNNINASGVIAMIGQIRDWLDQLRSGELIDGIDIPFADGTLGKVLDFADMVADTLLTDDNDTPSDSTDDVAKLLNLDGTATFKSAQELMDRLGTLLGSGFGGVAYEAASGELTYTIDLSHTLVNTTLPIDFSLDLSPFLDLDSDTEITVQAHGGLSLTLGIDLSGITGSTISNDTVLSELNDGTGAGIKEEIAVMGPQDVRTIRDGRLSQDAHFTVQFDAETAVAVMVDADATGDNNSLGNLVADVNDAFDAAAIDTRISAAVDGNRIKFTVADGTVDEVTVAFQNTDPAAIQIGLVADSFERDADGDLEFRTGRDAPATVGALTGDAQFTVNVGGTSFAAVIDQDETLDSSTIVNVVEYVNRALFHRIHGADVSSFDLGDVSFELTIESDNPELDGTEITVSLQNTETSATTTLDQLVALVNDKLQSALITAVGGSAPLVLEAIRVGGAIEIHATTADVTGFSFDLLSGTGLGISDGATSNGVSDKVIASSQGNRLVISARDPLETSLTVTATNDIARMQLGLGTDPLTGNQYDLRIVTSDGSAYRVFLDNSVTIADVLAKINGQTLGDVTATVTADGTSIKLVDETFVNPASSTALFTVGPVNGSGAALKLGLLAMDISNASQTPDGMIIGAPLGGISFSDRLFVENAVVEGQFRLSDVAGVNASANFGFVGVNLSGDTDVGAKVTAGLKAPGPLGEVGGRVTLSQLLEAIESDNIRDVVALPTITSLGSDDALGLVDIDEDGTADFGGLDLTVSLTPTLPAIGIPTPQIEIRIVDFGDPFADELADKLPDIEVATEGLDDLQGLGDLDAFRDLDLADILAGLDALIGFLEGFETFEFLSAPLPLVGVSVHDMVSVAQRFNDAVSDIKDDPASSLQLLENKLKEALGLPPTPDFIDFLVETGADGKKFFRIDLDFSQAFSETLGISLDLSDFIVLPDGFGGDIVELAGSAGLIASGNFDVTLAFGFDLEHPTDVYVFDETGIEASITAAATDMTFRAAIGPFGLFVAGGTANIAAGVQAGIASSVFTDGRARLSDIFSDGLLGNIEVDPTGTITATLPIFFPTDSVALDTPLTFSANLLTGDIDIDVPALTIDPSQFSLFDQLVLAVDGIDLFLEGLQDLLDGEVFGLELPLIGDKLASAADFIQDLREDFINPLRNEIEQITDPDNNIISELLFDLLSVDSDGDGPDIGLGLLQDFDPTDGETEVNVNDVRLTTSSIVGEEFIQWNFKLGDTLLDVGTDIGFDIGIPGLGLETEGDINLNIAWALSFGFGVSKRDGVYLDVYNGGDPELEVTATVTTPGLAVTGQLAFLQITAEERVQPGDDPETHLTASFGIDIYNRSDEDDQRLSFSELGSIGIAPTVQADAVVDLELELALNSELIGGVATVFPKITSGFILEWSLDDEGGPINLLTDSIGNAFQEGLKRVAFEDVGLDLGSFLTDVIGPVVQKVQSVTQPIQPIIEMLTTPIPVISDLSGPVTLLDIAGQFGTVNTALIKAIADIITLVNSIPTPAPGENLVIVFGDFAIFDADGTGALDSGTLFSKKPDLSQVDLPTPPPFGSLLAQKPASATKSFTQKLTSGGFGSGFSFPIFQDPSQVFGLLMGQPAVLIGYDMPPLVFDFEYTQFFSIFGPLGVSITGSMGATIDFAFGYDTLGLTQFFDSGFRNPELLFNGFFVSDNPASVSGDGPDDPEVQLRGGLSAAAELNLGVARAGVAGGIFVEIDFNLFDPDHDGRVRITELIGSIEDQLRFGGDLAFLAPLAIFDVSGEVFAKLFAFLKIDLLFFSLDKTFNITPQITLVEFDIPFTRSPFLASEIEGDGGESVLQLNLGEFAEDRLNGNIKDGNEHFTVSGDANELTVAWVNGGGFSRTYKPSPGQSGFTKIIAIGGEGNDTIDLSGVVDASIEFELEGGAGNDVLIAGAGAALIRGGSGDDEIWGGSGADLLFGESGFDVIHGGGGTDIIFGDGGTENLVASVSGKDGDDEIHGDGGDDFLFGGGGNDEIHGGSGADYIVGDGGSILRTALGVVEEVKDTARGQIGGDDDLFGDDGDDWIYGGRGIDLIEGGGHDDHLFGEQGMDEMHGGSGDDDIFGGIDADTITGGMGEDTIFGEDGNDTIHGDDEVASVGNDDVIDGGRGADQLFGDGGNDQIWGRSDPDLLDGGAGEDRLEGNQGNDVVRGGADADRIFSGFGSDTLDGQGGGDFYSIDTRGGVFNELTTIYDSGANDASGGVDILQINGTTEDDIFLLRAMADAYDDTDATDTGFVAKINAGGAAIERFNYRNMERMSVNGFYGDDTMVSDDTLAEVTLNGGVGDDLFQVGQVFRSERDDNPETADIAEEDAFATIEITRGWLSNGISDPMTINGGDGEDEFVVFHNLDVLTLNGGDGDDLFTVRAFALAGSQEDSRGRTDMKGDAGADTILYAVNAPVGIDGGDGFDTVKVIGTEFSDDFVVTDDGVFGGGLNITYVAIEKLVVDGAEGDDRYFVLSTSESVVTEIDGGLGSDTFFVGGNPSGEPIPVISNDLKGHSGIILHSVENTAGDYDGIKAEGISANVADNDEPFIMVTPSGAGSTVAEVDPADPRSALEGWGYDMYTVRLTRDPTSSVTLNVLSPAVSPEDEAQGSRTIEFWNGAAWVADLQLTFTGGPTGDWNDAQTVKFRAVQDEANEGTRFGIINHKVVQEGGGGEYDSLAMLSVKVQIHDDDRDSVIITRSGDATRVFEGGITDTYDVVLAHRPDTDVTVNLASAFGVDTDLLLSEGVLTFTSDNWLIPQTITLTAIDDETREGFEFDIVNHTVSSDDTASTDDGHDVITVPDDTPRSFVLLSHRTITGTVSVMVNGQVLAPERFEVLGNTLAFLQADGDFEFRTGTIDVTYDFVVPGYDEVAVERVAVEVQDDDAPSVVIMQTGGSTDVGEGGATDNYSIVLSSAPTGEVDVVVKPVKTRTTQGGAAFFEVQVQVSSLDPRATPEPGTGNLIITFNSDNWDDPVLVHVEAIDDTRIDGSDTQVFASGLQTVNRIKGPLFIEGEAGDGSISLPEPLILPTELNLRATDGNVVGFESGGTDGIEFMTVDTADLLAKLAVPGLPADTDQLIGKTIEITLRRGEDELFDRFWQILETETGDPGETILTLRNPTQFDFAAAPAPTNVDNYAVTTLSTNFFVNEADQVDFTFVFDNDSVAHDAGRLSSADFDGTTKGRITGFGMGPDTRIGEDDIPGGITYADMEVLSVHLGTGDDDVFVDSTPRRDDGFYTVTLLHTGTGNDEVDVMLTEDEDGAFSLDTGDGNDTVHASGSSLPLVIFGGAGADSIESGTGDDIIFGDRGRVDYVNGDGEIITRLGYSVAPIPTSPITGADANSLADGAHVFPTAYDGLTGLVVRINAGAGAGQARIITGNDAHTLNVDSPWLVQPSPIDNPATLADERSNYRISVLPEDQTDGMVRGPRLIFSVDNEIGGIDTITGNDGDDTIIGGAGGDDIEGNLGDDLITGDNARLDFVPVSGDDGLTRLNVARTIDAAILAGDTIAGNEGIDLILGGEAGDTIFGNDGDDLVFGDHARLDFDGLGLRFATVIDKLKGGDDVIEGNGGNDVLIAGTGADSARGGDENDIVFGDHAQFALNSLAGSFGSMDYTIPEDATPTAIFTGSGEGAGNDLLFGDGADDMLLGQQGADIMFGGDGDDDIWGGHNVAGGFDTDDTIDAGAGFDVVLGDNGYILRRTDTFSPLFRQLLPVGTLFHGYTGSTTDGDAAVDLSVSHDTPDMVEGDFTRAITIIDHADGTIADVYGADAIAGGAGDDMIFGQLGDDTIQGDGSASVDMVTRTAQLDTPNEDAGDGDDYIEGNGGADWIYGNLGQDDILGGSSDLFGLTTAAMRPDGDDTIYGGAATDAGRYYQDTVDLHARDADVILGDNGRIFKVVGPDGAYLTFNYDNYGESFGGLSSRIIPRANDLLDYTPGTGSPPHRSGNDMIFGESGDDIIHGMTGEDILFGNAGDDDLYGGVGDDWMSGGNGVDGMLGDDGKIFTSRNGLTEPLHGLTAVNAQQTISTPGNWLSETIFVTDELNKSVDLEPWDQGGDDVMYGGLGQDFMHGGQGIDGMSGAEALQNFYDDADARNQTRIDGVLTFNASTSKFNQFDNTHPLDKIAGFFLNFEASIGGVKVNDGDDRLFGDLGNDWLVGGTSKDHLYGGYGDDVLNADDNLETTTTDQGTGQFGDADIAFGGAGRDQLIANTGADRLIDWSGEFNAYWVPFSPYGQGTVSRNISPNLPEFLYALSQADGADRTRPGDPVRFGEPNGELGLVTQGDPDWGLQHDGPNDPQAGNGKSKKDIQR